MQIFKDYDKNREQNEELYEVASDPQKSQHSGGKRAPRRANVSSKSLALAGNAVIMKKSIELIANQSKAGWKEKKEAESLTSISEVVDKIVNNQLDPSAKSIRKINELALKATSKEEDALL
mmetsp:Transcript_38605/g.58759  ORF Transcript_38605/g.58759 Transcript_38605/m.58759 type:complete len:121 (+) Transcript_38605:1145-1507(+)|eukprot:CAMPEP_0170510356 /NCGR_PEP_ID=MMETSP0208-20121228/65723_1 /TAXON_ID=197538 /ORGANISM="Strombidium inclinatum, Strain S3" /LENGTH=120 /DNA_ID=CAMNT_0010793813 /DNA_START=1542 /DNA_END=1904 /DNA_ORIENTATION=-